MTHSGFLVKDERVSNPIERICHSGPEPDRGRPSHLLEWDCRACVPKHRHFDVQACSPSEAGLPAMIGEERDCIFRIGISHDLKIVTSRYSLQKSLGATDTIRGD